MSDQIGTMGVKEGTAMVFILLLPRVTLNSFTIVIAQQGQLGWLYLLINGLAVLAIAGMLFYVCSKVKGDLYSIIVAVVGKGAAKVIMMIYFIVFFINAASLTRQYAESTIITALPDLDLQLSLLLYAIGGLLTAYLGANSVARCSVIFMPSLIATFLGATLLLYPFYVPYELLPWQGYGLGKCLVQGFKGAGYNVGFLAVFILAPAFQNIKTIRQSVIRGIASSVLLKVFVMVVFLMVFGVAVGSEKTIPFFELARLIYLNRFFQHLEALFIVAWVILGTLAIAINLFIAAYLLGRLLTLSTNRPIMPCLAMLMTSLALLPENIMQVVVLDNAFLYVDDIAIYVIPLLLFVATLSQQKKGALWEKST
jgi:spore germination protein (amino acid permease)